MGDNLFLFELLSMAQHVAHEADQSVAGGCVAATDCDPTGEHVVCGVFIGATEDEVQELVEFLKRFCARKEAPRHGESC